MNENEISDITFANLQFSPNAEQLALIRGLSSFIVSKSSTDIFVLNGYAGTGKSSIMGAFIKTLASLKKKTIVLAPTGRAAKVAASFAGKTASTIHKRLYRGNSADPLNTTYYLAENKDIDTLFIIDEASLIPDGDNMSNSLLLQIVHHVYSSKGCSIILVGDMAQLPPVGQKESFAMNLQRLRNIGLNPISYSLSQPARQAVESGVLFNATLIRQALFSNSPLAEFSLFKTGFTDVEMVTPHEFLDNLSSSYAMVGKDETIVITRSNFRANNINATIRRYLLEADEPLVPGERLIISKNDYFWSKENKLSNLLANGEMVEIIGRPKKIKKYGRWFADTEMRMIGNDKSLTAKLILRSLVADGPTLPKDEMERFYNRVLAETEGELSDKIKAALINPYYNSLQVKYGYCVTCHKAQGGQWKHVFIDLGGIPPDTSENNFYRWLYTAITRASEKVFFINSPFNVE